MRFGIGSPMMTAGVGGVLLQDWARAAEAAGFDALVTRDRWAWNGYEPLTVLAAAAGATRTIELVANVVVAPTRSVFQLGKIAATVDQISGGRLLLGVGVGERADDFAVTETRFRARGARFDRDLGLLHDLWRGESVLGSPAPACPPPVRDARVPILIGGTVEQNLERTVRWGVGWTMSGKHPETYRRFIERLNDAWAVAGREGRPRICAVTAYALGRDDEAREYASSYSAYRRDGDDHWARAPKRRSDVARVVETYAAVGVTDMYFAPVVPELEQVEFLADALRAGGYLVGAFRT